MAAGESEVGYSGSTEIVGEETSRGVEAAVSDAERELGAVELAAEDGI